MVVSSLIGVRGAEATLQRKTSTDQWQTHVLLPLPARFLSFHSPILCSQGSPGNSLSQAFSGGKQLTLVEAFWCQINWTKEFTLFPTHQEMSRKLTALLSWPVWLSWLEHQTPKGWGSIPGQGTYLGC